MTKLPNEISYCGMDCSTCRDFLATQANNQEELQQIADHWSSVEHITFTVTVEDVMCDGCRANKRRSFHCPEDCKIRSCCIENSFDSCIECEKYPCHNQNSLMDQLPDIETCIKT